MVLDSKREDAEPILGPAAEAMKGISPNTLSAVAIILAAAAGATLYFSPDHWEILLPLGSILVLVSGFFDAVDGKVARLVGQSSPSGDMLDHVLDRYADVFIIGGVAISTWCHPVIGILALVGVLLTSYMGTQAQAMGVGRMYRGLMGRADRIVLLFAAPLIQWGTMFYSSGVLELGFISLSIMEIMMLWLAVVGNLTAVQRAWGMWKALD